MSTIQKIPIENIYFLLCYAWDKLDERDIIEVSGIDTTNLVDLFSQVLISGLHHLLKRGVDRGYIPYSEDTGTIRGKLCFNSTLKRNLLVKGRVHCEYDELNHNVLHNQIIKTTLRRLISVESLDKKLREKLLGLYRYLHEVDDINLSSRIFSCVQLHRNNSFYDFLLKICELVYDNLLVSEKPGKSKFRDYLRDDGKMASIFEEFVRNFYRIETPQYRVKREDIKWITEALDEESANLLPIMSTDISITSETAKTIIETKYYKETFSKHYDREKIHSKHLYQLYAYLKNVEAKGGLNENCTGILLYPVVDNEVNLNFTIQNHKVMIKTINLKQHWESIYRDLIEILESGMKN